MPVISEGIADGVAGPDSTQPRALEVRTVTNSAARFNGVYGEPWVARRLPPDPHALPRLFPAA